MSYERAALQPVPESVAVITALNVPAIVGVPLIAPVEPLSVTPFGRAPAVTLNETVPVAPVSVSCAEYAALTCPSGSVDGSRLRLPHADVCSRKSMFAVVAPMVAVIGSPVVGSQLLQARPL